MRQVDWDNVAREGGYELARPVFRDEAREILARIDAGDTDVIPSPLSGEWSGESIPEVFGLEVGEEWPADEQLDRFESLYVEAYIQALRGIAYRDRSVTE